MQSFTSARAAAVYILTAGLAAGLSQVVLFRELLVVATGTELVIGLLLAVWLAGGAVGSYWAESGATNPRAQVLRAWKLAWLPSPALAAGVLVVRASRPLLAFAPNALAAHFPPQTKIAYVLTRLVAVQPGEVLGLPHIIAVSLLATLPAAFCCGAQFVTGARILRSAAGVGRAYALDAVGHLLGGVALALAATVWLDGLWVAAAILPLVVAAGWCISRRVSCPVLPVVVPTVVVLCGVMVILARPSQQWRWPQQRVLAERASTFGLVTVAEQRGGGVYFFQNGVPSGASPPTPHMEVLVNFALLHVPQPRRILLIGGGATGGVYECLKHKPERIDYVEFDPVFLQLARRWASSQDRTALHDPRVRCFACDPRLILARSHGIYDAIIMALPPPTTALLNRFFTREGFALCRSGLTDSGAIAFTLPYSQIYRSELLAELNRCLYHAARAGYPDAHTSFLTGDELTVVLTTGRAGRERSAAITAPELLPLLLQRGVHAPYLSAFAWDWLDPTNLQQARDMLAGPAPPNSDMRPVGYLLGTVYWLAQVTPTAGAILMPLLRQPFAAWDILPWLLIAPIIAAAAFVRIHSKRFRRMGAWVLMATAGFAGMAAETAILLLMQSWHGYVYGLIGVVVGAFMVGLALGSIAADAGPRRTARSILAVVYAASLALTLYTAFVTHEPLPVWAFPLVTLVPGSLVGFAFPTAVRLWSRGGTRGIGIIYAADLIGGIAAALLVPAIFVPLAGVFPSAIAPVIGTLILFLALFG
jgi:spermidine synthase